MKRILLPHTVRTKIKLGLGDSNDSQQDELFQQGKGKWSSSGIPLCQDMPVSRSLFSVSSVAEEARTTRL